MQDAGVKLSSVAADILGVSGRAMLTALVEGTRDPGALDLARGQLSKKIPQLKDALTGRFGAHHALVVGTILSHLEFLDEAIAHLSAEIEEVIAPFAAEVELLTTWVTNGAHRIGPSSLPVQGHVPVGPEPPAAGTARDE